ncbi:MAG: hypothetical protein ACJ76L_05045 [Conexibacter sp.]
MPEIQASRRLVKSPPELWAEVSDAASLARHLGEVGEITITRLEPETTVAWEGERASGTIELAPAGWGTSVTLTAEPAAGEPDPPTAETEPPTPEPVPEPTAVAEPEPEAAATAAPKPESAATEPEPEATTTAEPEPEPAQPEPAADATPVRRSWLARLFSRTPKPPTAPEPQPSTTDADRAGGDEDARPPAEGPVGAHPESSGPARQAAEPEQEAPADPEPEPEPKDPLEAVLAQALDSLGQAHHRPFSRG